MKKYTAERDTARMDELQKGLDTLHRQRDLLSYNEDRLRSEVLEVLARMTERVECKIAELDQKAVDSR